MRTLVFATNNPNKAREVRELLGDEFDVRTLADIGCTEDIPETAPTLEGNAEQKAAYLLEHYNMDCFADDTGLEVTALNGEPGVRSARYAGDQRDTEANMSLVLNRLEGKTDRSARFRTVVCLKLEGETHFFEGSASGAIIQERTGDKGFGYDPVFLPDGADKTFAQMSTEEKNALSHRAKAVNALVQFLRNRE